MFAARPLYPYAMDRLLSQGESQAITCMVYMLVRANSLESTSETEEEQKDKALVLTREVMEREDVRLVRSTARGGVKTKKESNLRLHAHKCLEAFATAVVNLGDFGLLEKLFEVLVWTTGLEKRQIRYLGVDACMELLATFCSLSKSKQSLVEELGQHSERPAKERTEEARKQVEWLKKMIERLQKQVLYERVNDIMPEIRAAIAGMLVRVSADESLHLLLNKPTMKLVGQLLFDHNKGVKKRALDVAANVLRSVKGPELSLPQTKIKDAVLDMYDERHIARIIRIGYQDMGTVAVKAVKTLEGMYRQNMLDEVAIDSTCRLVMRKFPPQVAREAARFIVKVLCEGKILGLEYEVQEGRPSFSQNEVRAKASVGLLADILARGIASIPLGLRQKTVQDAMSALETETVSAFDVKSMCDLLMRGEKDQQSESKLKENQQDAICHMLLAATRRIDRLREEKEGVDRHYEAFKKAMLSNVDGILLGSLPKLLSLQRHNDRVQYLTKIAHLISRETVVGNTVNLLQLQKIFKKTQEVFRVATSERVARAASRALARMAGENPVDPTFAAKLSQLYEDTIHQIDDFLRVTEGMKNRSPSLMKLPLISASCETKQISLLQTVIVPLITERFLSSIPMKAAADSSEDSTDTNLLHIFNGLFALYANALTQMCREGGEKLDPEKFEQLRQEVLAAFVASIKLFEEKVQVSARCWILLSNLIVVSSNDTMRLKYNDLYYDVDRIVLSAMTDYLLDFIRLKFENDEEIVRPPAALSEDQQLVLEMNRALQLLIQSCEPVFQTELSVMYLAIFGSNQKNALLGESMRTFLRRLSARCVLHRGKSMYFMYVKEAITTCFNFGFQYPDMHSEELQRRLKAEGRKLDCRKYYSLLRAKELMKLVLSCCNFALPDPDADTEEDLEANKQVLEQVELFGTFVIDLLKESLRSAGNFPLLEVVQMGVITDAFPKEKLGWMIQLYDALTQHVLHVDPTVDEDNKALLAEFKNGLYQKAATRQIKRTPYGKALVASRSHDKKRTIIVSEKKELKKIEEAGSDDESVKKKKPIEAEGQDKPAENEKEKEKEQEQEGQKKRERSASMDENKSSSAKKKIDFAENNEEGSK